MLPFQSSLKNWTALYLCILALPVTMSRRSSHGGAASSQMLGTHPVQITFDEEVDTADVMSHNKVVVCYLGTWATYRLHEGAYDLIKNFNPKLCTHLIYSFAGLDNKTYEMKPLDPYLDLEEEYGRGWYRKSTALKARHPHLKILLAVGGWNEGSIKYSEMASTPATRKKFIDSALELVRKHGFDGLDLDWEYPGNRDGKPEDKAQFTILVQELRRELDQYGLLLTAAFGASKEIAEKAYDLPELSGLLDHIHLMCYDYHGSWDKRTYHNAPLRSEIGNLSIEFSVDYYLSQGVNPNKLVLGLPLYGRTFLLNDTDVPGSGLLKDAEDKGFQGPYTKEDGFLGYNEIVQKLASDRGDWKTYWDSRAQVPYMRNGAKWVSFDNPDSLIKKVELAMSRGLRGAMVWSIDTDDFLGSGGGGSVSAQYPLLRAINYALSRSKGHAYTPTTTSSEKPVTPGSGSKTAATSTSITAASLYTLMLIVIFTAMF